MVHHRKKMTATRLAVLLVAGAWAAQAQAQRGTTHADITSRATPIRVEELTPLESPWAAEVMPDGGVLITEKPGRLRVWRAGELSAPIAGVPAVVFRDQGGLLDVALDPGFSRNGVIYLAYSEAASSQTGAPEKDTPDPRLGVFQDLTDTTLKGLAVARAELAGSRLRNVRVIWQAEKTAGRGHYGGRLICTPDGAILITSGDRQRFEPAQVPDSDLGKVIRIRASDGAPLSDNPFFDKEEPQRDVWSLGHRNPLGIALRPGTTEVWVAEMGPQNGDEINVIARGGNFGWPLVSAGDNYNATPLARPEKIDEFVTARTSFPLAVSPSSLAFYDSDLFATWKGDVLVGTLNRPGIVRGTPGADGVHDLEHIATGFRVRDVAVAPDGALLVLRDGADGALLRLTPAPSRSD